MGFNGYSNYIGITYAQAVVSWQVTALKKPVEVNFPGGQMTHGGSGSFTTYNADQKAIINAFVAQNNAIEKDAFYLFFVEGVKSKERSISGYMPLQRQIGFIYDSPNNTIVAHELAHGAFNLYHTFSEHGFIAPEGKTQNLMDYTPGSKQLWKHQWDKIHNPENIVFGFMQDEEEGEAQLVPDLVCTQKFIEQFRRAYANKIKIEYEADGYPWFGHYANNMLLDGEKYEQIYVAVRQDLGFVPTKTEYTYKGGKAILSYGSVLSIEVSDNFENAYKYLFPTKEQWESQIKDVVDKIAEEQPLKEVIKTLAILPPTEFKRLNETQVKACMRKLADKRFLMEDYASCINDEEIIINLLRSCKDNVSKQKALLEALMEANAMNRLMIHLDGKNRKELILTVAKYFSNVCKPDMYEINREYFNYQGNIYTKVFSWEETVGLDKFFVSENMKLSGEFKISTKHDFLSIFQEEEYLMQLGAFEYVSLTAENAKPYLPKDYVVGESVLLMPAFLFHYILEGKEFDQVLNDISTLADIGITVATMGTYAAGKKAAVISSKAATNMAIDFVLQAAIISLDPNKDFTSIKYSDVVYSGASSLIDNPKLSIVISTVRTGVISALSQPNGNFEERLLVGLEEALVDVVVGFVTYGITGNKKYIDLLEKTFNNNPQGVYKSLRAYGISSDLIKDISAQFTNKTLKEVIKTMVSDEKK